LWFFFQKFLKRFLSEPAASHDVEPKGFIQAEQLCDYCQQPSTRNRKGRFEALLFCKDCTAKGYVGIREDNKTLGVVTNKFSIY
jgi:hypothetical protein